MTASFPQKGDIVVEEVGDNIYFFKNEKDMSSYVHTSHTFPVDLCKEVTLEDHSTSVKSRLSGKTINFRQFSKAPLTHWKERSNLYVPDLPGTKLPNKSLSFSSIFHAIRRNIPKNGLFD